MDMKKYNSESQIVELKDLNIDTHDLPVNCVIALTKTGDVIIVDIKTGLPVFKNSYKNIELVYDTFLKM
jgi:hypothetical protein